VVFFFGQEQAISTLERSTLDALLARVCMCAESVDYAKQAHMRGRVCHQRTVICTFAVH
jgi:hypothetical protein